MSSKIKYEDFIFKQFLSISARIARERSLVPRNRRPFDSPLQQPDSRGEHMCARENTSSYCSVGAISEVEADKSASKGSKKSERVELDPRHGERPPV